MSVHGGKFSIVLLSLTLLSTVAQAAVSWTATPFNPPSVPLAVRTPYLSAWLPQGGGTALNAAWPTFWNGDILGWAGYVRVDGTAYSFLGLPVVQSGSAQKASQKSATFSATQSVFVMSAGPVDLTVSFLSPVEPNDLVKQSLPLSYMSLSAASTDGKSHSVQVYSDISAEWVSGNSSLTATWNTTSGDIVTHQVQLQTPSQYTEVNDHIQQGSAYYSSSGGATYQSGSDNDVRSQFVQNGQLANTQDTNFRAINDQFPVFGLAHDLGNVSSASSPVLYSIGHFRDPAIQYIVAGNTTQDRSSYFWSQYSSASDAISAFHSDYNDALTRAKNFDSKLDSDASAVSTEYAGITALSVRQFLGATEITISKDSSGAWNTSDVLMFMKEISSDGNVNTVDVIFPAWPGFLYTNPSLGKYLLSPLFQYQASGLYPNKYSVHDLGASYPKALGHNDGKDEAMPLEECGNMLIMTLSYYQKTQDASLIKQYYRLLDQWAQFLIQEALIPAEQISTDDFAGKLANQTNLAIKGIIGIKAMSEIANVVGDSTANSNYSSIASDYVGKWQPLAKSTDGSHLTLSYGNDSSWGLTYNLFADKHLKLNLFPDSIYTMQDQWYPSVAASFGVPLDTRHTYTKSDWQIYMAAIATDTNTRDLFIKSVQKTAANGLNNAPFSDFYDTVSGQDQGFRARPVVGGHLALLVSSSNITSNNSATSGSSKSSAKRGMSSSSLLAIGLSLCVRAVLSLLL